MLADVPNFKEERVRSNLPVLDEPASASAEAFRFVSASISLQQLWPANDDGSKNFKSLVALSAGLAEGKTVVMANTAFAAAREGHKVLLVDADFGNQQLTELIHDRDLRRRQIGDAGRNQIDHRRNLGVLQPAPGIEVQQNRSAGLLSLTDERGLPGKRQVHPG